MKTVAMLINSSQNNLLKHIVTDIPHRIWQLQRDRLNSVDDPCRQHLSRVGQRPFLSAAVVRNPI